MVNYDMAVNLAVYYFSNKKRKRIGLLEVHIILWLVYFFINQSKNNALLEPKIEHF